MSEKINIEIKVKDKYFKAISNLPWDFSLSEWEKKDVKILKIKSGISRHPVLFVKSAEYKFAIKETNAEVAEKEIKNYERLVEKNIPTLEPVGIVIKNQEPILQDSLYGIQLIDNRVGYTVTLLAEKVLPDSLLYGRGFTTQNKNKIWDVVVKLFVRLHTNGIYWGDASLSNMLIHFGKEEVPKLGKRTVLKALLADAETVEIPESLSDSLKKFDVEYFFESIDWLAEDLKNAGVYENTVTTYHDKEYILKKYEKLMRIEQKEKEFEEITKLNVKKCLGDFSEIEYGDVLLKHIQEHKWYLNEDRYSEIPINEASLDWYRNIFTPICESFREENLLELFPGKTATDLYVEIMQNKYFLSEKVGRDVGFIVAMKDYCSKFVTFKSDLPSHNIIKSITKTILRILGKRETKIIEELQDFVGENEEIKVYLLL